MRAEPSDRGMMFCTEPLPKERSPMIRARFWSRRAPATISEAEAEPALMITTTGTSMSPAWSLAS